MLGERIRQTLKEKGVTQKALAERAGLTEASVSRYISGDRTPNAEHLRRICNALEVSADWLLELEVKHEKTKTV